MFHVGIASAHFLSLSLFKHTFVHAHIAIHTRSFFYPTHSPPFHTHYFSSLEKLNGVKLSVGPSVSWVLGRDEKDSAQWEGHIGGKGLEEEKGREDWGQVH